MKRVSLESVIKTALIIAIGFVVFTVVSLQRNNMDILTHVKEQQDVSDNAVKDLKDDNAQQTVILCTLILSNNVEVKQEDTSKIEAICKQKIQQSTGTNADTAPASQVSGSSGVQGTQASGGSSPNNVPSGTTAQPNTSQNNDNPQPPPPDNNGIIVDLPLLPPIHIPSPL